MPDPNDTPVTEDDLKKRPPLQDNLGMGPAKVAAPMSGPSLVPPIGRPVSATGVPMYNQNDPVPATGTAPPVNSHVQEIQRLGQTGSGVEQVQAKHPFWGGVLRGLDTAASIIAPPIASAIPGTTLHHQDLIHQQEGLANQDIAQQEKQAQTQDVQSQIPLREAQTKDIEAQEQERLHPKPQLQMTDEGLVRVPQEGEATPVTMAGQNLQKPAAPDKPENAQLQAENAWLSRPENKGKDLADAQKWYTALSPQARQEFHIAVPRAEAGNYVPVNDKAGNVIGWVDPKSGNFKSVNDIHGLGQAMGGSATLPPKPTTQMRNVEAQSEIVSQGTQPLISEISTLAPKLGPLQGRWNEFMQGKVGMEDPDFAGLRADLLMYSSAVALMHARGRLPENLRAEFDHTINAPNQSPQNLITTIQHIQTWVDRNKNAMSGGESSSTGSPKPGTVEGGYKFKGGDASDPKNWEKAQ